MPVEAFLHQRIASDVLSLTETHRNDRKQSSFWYQKEKSKFCSVSSRFRCSVNFSAEITVRLTSLIATTSRSRHVSRCKQRHTELKKTLNDKVITTLEAVEYEDYIQDPDLATTRYEYNRLEAIVVTKVNKGSMKRPKWELKTGFITHWKPLINDTGCFENDEGIQDPRVTLIQLMMNDGCGIENYKENRPSRADIPTDDILVDQAVDRWNSMKASGNDADFKAMNILARAVNSFLDFTKDTDRVRLEVQPEANSNFSLVVPKLDMSQLRRLTGRGRPTGDENGGEVSSAARKPRQIVDYSSEDES